MAIELKVPSVGESITEVFIGEWLVKEGAYVSKDKDVVELESDKATVNLAAPQGGVISRVLKKKGESAAIGEVIGYLEPQAAPQKSSESTPQKQDKQPEAKAPAPKAPAEEQRVMPAAKRMMEEKGIQPGQVPASGPGGRTLKEDVIRYEQNKGTNQGETRTSVPAKAPAPSNVPAPVSNVIPVEHLEEVVPMSPIRRKIAERLVEAQHNAALLTTFNEIDMTGVMDLRNRYKQSFVDRYNIKLGFMSFFVKAAIDALKQCPELNAEIRETNIIYRNHYDIGIAIGGGKGLVVPILRNADQMSFAETELAIAEFANRAQANKLRIEELMGGTFTISNGGVYGSLLSTPIVNPPQSGVLGMHSIQKRPVVIDDQIVIRQMMYIALTYDHRIVDGKEAVTFLKRIKDTIEDPTRILLEV